MWSTSFALFCFLKLVMSSLRACKKLLAEPDQAVTNQFGPIL